MPGHLQIRQPGLTCSAQPEARSSSRTFRDASIFDIHRSAGLRPAKPPSDRGTCVEQQHTKATHFHGGAIHNHGTLNLVNVTITGNHALRCASSSLCGGGGIYNATNASAR